MIIFKSKVDQFSVIVDTNATVFTDTASKVRVITNSETGNVITVITGIK